jgi:tripartite motif-containing protein 71
LHCITLTLDAESVSVALQVLDPSGRFLRAFGSQGTADGRFNYPWGITTDALGFIYICDKENHRVQVNEEWSLVIVGSLMEL